MQKNSKIIPKMTKQIVQQRWTHVVVSKKRQNPKLKAPEFSMYKHLISTFTCTVHAFWKYL